MAPMTLVLNTVFVTADLATILNTIFVFVTVDMSSVLSTVFVCHCGYGPMLNSLGVCHCTVFVTAPVTLCLCLLLPLYKTLTLCLSLLK